MLTQLSTTRDARFPAAAAGLLAVGLIIGLGRRLYGDRAGLLAGAILATNFGFIFYARRATADMETLAGVLAAVWAFERLHLRGSGSWVVGLWVWMAVVSLTKGLLGFALPIAVFSVFGAWSAWAERGERKWMTALVEENRWFLNRWTFIAAPLGLAIYLLPFLISAQQSGGIGGLEMVWRENIRRFVVPHNHTGPIYLYVGVIFVIAAPWAVFLPAALLRPMSTDRGDRLIRAYFWAIFAFFTLSASRRSYYLLPILPAASLLIARILSVAPDEGPVWAKRLRSFGWWVMAAAALTMSLTLLPPAWLLPAPYDRLPPLPGRPIIIIVLVLVCVMLWRNSADRVQCATAIVFVASLHLFAFVFPELEQYRTRRPFVHLVRDQTAADPRRLGLLHASDTVFDLGRTAPEFDRPEELIAAIRAGDIRWILGPRKLVVELRPMTSVVAEERSQPWEIEDQLGNKLILLEANPRKIVP